MKKLKTAGIDPATAREARRATTACEKAVKAHATHIGMALCAWFGNCVCLLWDNSPDGKSGVELFRAAVKCELEAMPSVVAHCSSGTLAKMLSNSIRLLTHFGSGRACKALARECATGKSINLFQWIDTIAGACPVIGQPLPTDPTKDPQKRKRNGKAKRSAKVPTSKEAKKKQSEKRIDNPEHAQTSKHPVLATLAAAYDNCLASRAIDAKLMQADMIGLRDKWLAALAVHDAKHGLRADNTARPESPLKATLRKVS